jgi:hypothetical protein
VIDLHCGAGCARPGDRPPWTRKSSSRSQRRLSLGCRSVTAIGNSWPSTSSSWLWRLASQLGSDHSSKPRGQNFATKRDFDELLKQQRATAEAVETIKSEVGQRDWAQREWTTLRRVKLEAFLEKMHECESYLDRRRESAIDGKAPTPERDCINEVDTLAALYFPELENEVHPFVLNCRNQVLQLTQLTQAIFESPDATARQAAIDNFKSKWEYKEFLVIRNRLTEAARSLLERIMNVDDGTPQSDERRSEKWGRGLGTNQNEDCQTGPRASVKAIGSVGEKTRMTIRVG